MAKDLKHKEFDWKALLDDLQLSLSPIVKELARTEAKTWGKDFLAFVKTRKSKLEKWTKQRAAGELDDDDFVDLVHGEINTESLLLLKNKGLSLIRQKKYQELALNAVSGVLLKQVGLG